MLRSFYQKSSYFSPSLLVSKKVLQHQKEVNKYAFVRSNSNEAAVTFIKRNVYARLYPVVIVNQDGSTICVRHKEPRKIIKFPLDLKTAPKEIQEERLLRRKPKQKIVVEEVEEDNFNINQYSHLWKKK